MRGRLITLEGGEGAGKSTVIAALAGTLRERGIAFRQSREPGGTPAGEAIRSLLLDSARGTLGAEAELLLVFAARAQHVREVIEPALEAGEWVLCDRFTDASFAYQGGGRGLDEHLIADLERWAVRRKPDLTFLLDVPVQTGLQRARARGGEFDRIESEDEAFFERVREAYRTRAASDPQRFRVIDATQPADAVARAACGALVEWIDTGAAATARNDARR